MTARRCDVLVIGAGPGGYVAAIRAAQLGLDTICVEKENLGGVCLNWGCIPTKALLRSAEILELVHRAPEFGVQVSGVQFDFAAMIKRSRDIAAKISKGVDYLFRKNKITHLHATASLESPGRVRLDSEAGQEIVEAKHVIVATGARARSLPGIEVDGDRVITYRHALTLSEQPKSLAIIGAGAIGVEFASFYASLGTEVTIFEYLPHLVPNEDEEISAELERAFRKRKIKHHLGTSVDRVVTDSNSATLSFTANESGESGTLQCERVLMAVGVQGNVEQLGLETLGIGVERGTIVVDEHYRTAAEGVYAIGDVIATPSLAHIASAEGIYLAEFIAGKGPEPVPYDSNPACTYCHPEIASVGFTEGQAAEQGIPVQVGRFPFGPLGKTVAAGEYPGLVKMLWHAESGALLGAHLIGPAVTDLIAAPTLGKTTEVNAASFINTIWAHPTFAEALKEATEDALGHAIHI